MHKDAKIFIAGASGLVGSALVRALHSAGFNNLLTPTREALDLMSQNDVSRFFAEEKPEYVFLAAAKVGGIHANNSYPGEFIHENLAIQTNVIHQSYLNGVKRLLFLGSSCIYPKLAPQPLKEEYLLTGLLEPTNEPYAVAKIAGIKMCEAYNRQYGTEYIAVMPTNLYGPGDNFHPENSHVLPALIRRFHEAKTDDLDEVVVWGSGTPKREFLYVDDMAAGCLFLMQLSRERLAAELLAYPKPCFVNLGTGEDVSIRELACLVKKVTGFKGEIIFDASKPDGTPRKLQDVTRVNTLGWKAQMQLADGIEATYHWYLDNETSLRLH
jgi:GDP-L-fucose synthase